MKKLSVYGNSDTTNHHVHSALCDAVISFRVKCHLKLYVLPAPHPKHAKLIIAHPILLFPQRTIFFLAIATLRATIFTEMSGRRWQVKAP